MHYKDDFKEFIEMPFEFTTVPVCKNYDHALTVAFGDWHKFVKGGSHHEVIMNPDMAYPLFFENS